MRSAVLIYAFFATYVFFRADSMIFQPQPTSYQDTADILKIPVTPTESTSAIYLPNAASPYTLLYSHGNAEDLGDVRPLLERFHSWGFSVLAYDYRGYGTSDGQPSEKNTYQDIDAAYRYLTQKLGITPDHIMVYGRSVGGGPSTELATRHPVGGLILESTFTSAFRVVVSFPLLPFDKFPNLAKLKKVRCPVLVMHGQADSIIPVQHGQALYAAAPEPKLSLWVAGADHNDLPWVAGTDYRDTLLAFLALLKKQQK